ncbi:MAG: hypothetical protein IKR85_11875 [Clostridia bacterium]|nr:hypothetical protein [Clostridia bacterium]
MNVKRLIILGIAILAIILIVLVMCFTQNGFTWKERAIENRSGERFSKDYCVIDDFDVLCKYGYKYNNIVYHDMVLVGNPLIEIRFGPKVVSQESYSSKWHVGINVVKGSNDDIFHKVGRDDWTESSFMITCSLNLYNAEVKLTYCTNSIVNGIKTMRIHIEDLMNSELIRPVKEIQS